MVGYNQSESSSSGSQSTSVWKKQRPFLLDIFKRAQDQSNVPREYYPGATVAGRDPLTQRAIAASSELGLAGDPTLRAGADYTRDVLGGEYLNSNPHLDDLYDRAAGRTTEQFSRTALPYLEAKFGGAGRSAGPSGTGSGAYAGAQGRAFDQLGEGLADLSANIYAPNYEAERGRMDAAAARAPGYGAARQEEIMAAMRGGMSQEQLAQAMIEGDLGRHDFGQNEIWDRLALFSNLVGAPVMTSRGFQSSSSSSMSAEAGIGG
jgi:hypothetical protein